MNISITSTFQIMLKKKRILEIVDHAQAELRAQYKQNGYLGSNVLNELDELHDALLASVEKRKKPVDECYPEFVRIWTEQFPQLGFDAVAGNKMKSIITKTKQYLTNGGRPTDKESSCNMWQYIVKYLGRGQSWFSGKGLAIIESRFYEIVNEIKNGKQPRQNRSDEAYSYVNSIR